MDCKKLQDELALENLITGKKINRFPWQIYFCAWIADLLVVSNGMAMAWTSPVLPLLLSNNTQINPLGSPIKTYEVSLMATVPGVAATIAYIFWAKVIDTIGRKQTMRIISIIMTCSLLVTAFSGYIWIYYISLAVTGACVSGSVLSVSVYNTEIAAENIRGQLGCLMAMHIPIGLLTMYVFGSLTGIRDFTLICAIPLVLHLFLSPFIPESPVFLISKNRVSEASRALHKLKRLTNVMDTQLVFTKIKETSAKTMKQSSFLTIIKDPCARIAFLLSLQNFAIEQFSGIAVILTYVAPIFNKSGSGLSGNHVGIIVGLVKLFTFSLSVYFTDKVGRRKLLLCSTLFSGMSMFFLGLLFYLKHIQSHIIDSLHWVSILVLVLYISGYALGLGNVPMAFVGEVFPDHLRVRGVALTMISGGCLCSFIIFCFPLIESNFGLHTGFWICSGSSLIGFVSLYFTLPETKGKSFEQIQNILKMRLKK